MIRESDLTAADAAEPYQAAYEHLRDLLLLHDCRLHREVLRNQARKPTDMLGFAVVTDQEVVDLLGQAHVAPDSAERAAALAQSEQAIAQWVERIGLRLERTLACGVTLPIIELARRFGLSEFEVDVLVACLAAEVDRRYERIYGYLQDDMTRRQPSPGLLLRLCCEHPQAHLTARALLNGLAPLRYYQLIEVAEDSGTLPWLARPLRMDERIAGYLVGDEAVDARIARYLARLELEGDSQIALDDAKQQADLDALIQQLRTTLASNGRQRSLVYLHGVRNAGMECVAGRIGRELALPVLSIDAEALSEPGTEFERTLFLIFREALLSRSALFLHNIDRVLDQPTGQHHFRALQRYATQLGTVVLLSGEQPWHWPVPATPLVLRSLALRPAGYGEQLAAWRRLAGATLTDSQLQRLTSLHPLPLGAIGSAWRTAQALASPDAVRIEHLQQSCRAQSWVPTSALARRVVPRHQWPDLVLPSAQLEQLQALCSQAKHVAAVYGAWGFERKLSLGKGLNALFSGPPGTGKTLAAEVIAADLEVELLKIDLSQVVSKYIGETEKNLRQLFDHAGAARAILFFDEADALLGKRSEVKDAHDRYANTETAYLLQKMEEYEGITILASNLRQNMDEAFTRRMRFIVDFPFPEDEDRLRIWQTVWPKEVPFAPDVDLATLARQFRLSGGSIRNIALSAAFLAAEHGQAVAMRHLMHAAKRELQKMGRLVNDEEHRRYG